MKNRFISTDLLIFILTVASAAFAIAAAIVNPAAAGIVAAGLLVVLLVFQVSYFQTQKNKVSATMVVTIESVDARNGTITVTNANGDDKRIIVLEAPDLFRNMVVVGEQQYVASYDYYKNNPNKGKLSGLTIMEH